LGGYGLFWFTGSWIVGNVSLRSQIAVFGAFAGRIWVPRARSVDVVDVGRVIFRRSTVTFLNVRNGVGNVDWSDDADSEIGVILIILLAATVVPGEWSIRVRRQEKIGTAVSKNRPSVAITTGPKGRHAGSNTE
jgi:hypothetical protein